MVEDPNGGRIGPTLEDVIAGQSALAAVLNEVGESLIVVMQAIGVVIENQRAAAEFDTMYRQKVQGVS